MSDIFFGLQVAVSSPPHDPWRQKLCELVRRHAHDMSVQDKRGLYGSLANLLGEAADRCSLGYWDFIPNGKSDYQEWVSGIEDDSAELWVPDQTGARMDHVLVSAMFLLPATGASTTVVGDRCALDEAQFHTRATWRHLFATLAMLDFASVRGEAV
jgi:hypothetical protein